MQASLPQVDQLLADIKQQITQLMAEQNINNPLFVGICTGGVWLAEYLHKELNISEPLGHLNISFYRDDFSLKGLNPKVSPSQLSSTDGRHVFLIDDVVMSGRTIRAAMNELFDYGRPSSISLVALIDVPRRQLPIQPDICGARLELPEDQCVKLTGPEPLALNLVKRTNSST